MVKLNLLCCLVAALVATVACQGRCTSVAQCFVTVAVMLLVHSPTKLELQLYRVSEALVLIWVLLACFYPEHLWSVWDSLTHTGIDQYVGQ